MRDATKQVDDWYAKADPRHDEMTALRTVLRTTRLQETYKWSAPVYCWDGKNVAIVWNFKEAATLGFFRGVLLDDPEGRLKRPGANTRAARVARFSSVAQIEDAADWIRDTVEAAIGLVERGETVDLPKDDLDPPSELVERLKSDPDLRSAWNDLTPGRRRGYILHFSDARQSETRTRRIDKHAPRILQGKGMHDR